MHKNIIFNQKGLNCNFALIIRFNQKMRNQTIKIINFKLIQVNIQHILKTKKRTENSIYSIYTAKKPNQGLDRRINKVLGKKGLPDGRPKISLKSQLRELQLSLLGRFDLGSGLALKPNFLALTLSLSIFFFRKIASVILFQGILLLLMAS